MSQLDAVRAIAPGDEVFTADGERLGTVADIQHDVLVIEHIPPNAAGYVIPLLVIASADAGRVVLRVSRDELLRRDWDAPPAHRPVASTAVDVAADDEIRIPLRREELTATTRPVFGGPARIAKRFVREAPAKEDDIRVERRIVDRLGETGETHAFEQIIIEVPLQSDTADARQEARASDEILVSKETVQRIERVTGTVRREEVSIDGEVIPDEGPRGDSSPAV